MKKILVLFLIVSFITSFAQQGETPRPRKPKKEHILTPDEAKVVKKDAAEFFASGDYEGALKAYVPLQKADPKNADYNYRLGYCYVITNVDKTKAVPFLEYASRQKNVKNEVYYYLGQAYQYVERWDDAIRAFEQYKNISKSKIVRDLLDVDRQVEMCNTAKELSQHPVNVTFTNMGRTINSIYPDYNPFVSADRSILVFSSRRKGNAGGFIEELGMYTADVYWTIYKDTAWGRAKSIGASVNGPLDEESIGLNPSGTELFLFFDNDIAYGDVMSSKLRGKTWQRADALGGGIFSKAFETGATISPDGMTMYFASDRKEKSAFGLSDIYMSRRNEKGEWGPSENLGSAINTKYDEDSPFMSTDGKSLYFSSKGHNSMGGFDVFKTSWNDESKSWSEPENVGYPVNNADDNLYFSITGDGKYAYVTALRPEGLGEQDVYELTFNEPSGYVLYKAKMLNQPGAKVEYGSISLMDKSSAKKIIDTKLEYISGALMVSLKPGMYSLNVNANGFSPFQKDVEVPVNSAENIFDEIRLTPLGKSSGNPKPQGKK
ncbi:MAG: PD40 domain-containing protein [Bacteroidia bacterium]|nr:PD40 domain-containing protein [Bacteroidia bacterium]